MSDRIENFDRKISHVKDDIRIFYFLSESRDVIKEAVNNSTALHAKISNIRARGGGNLEKSFEEMVEGGECVSLAKVYRESISYAYLDWEFKNGEHIAPNIIRIFTLSDFHFYDERRRTGMVKAFLDSKEAEKTVLLISSHEMHIPNGFSNEIALIEDGYITENDICEKISALVSEEANDEKKKQIISRYGIPNDDKIKAVAKKFVGLSAAQIDNVLYLLKGELCFKIQKENSGKSIEKLIEAEREKEAKLDRTIKFTDVPKAETVTGMGNYTKWLEDRMEDYKNPSEARKKGTPAPKGVLFCGVPGTGKTAAARESANKLNVPLVQFDISQIQNEKFGGSEERMRKYLERIDAFGNCVLLIDEVEKLFATNGGETHEVTRKLMSQLLAWMQEHKGNVFLFLTANSIEGIPPELLRDGRIDARFFAFLPSCEDLANILKVLLKTEMEREKMAELFDENFCEMITKNAGEDVKKLCWIFDEIAWDAVEKAEFENEKEYRYPFMTGANLKALLGTTLRELWKNKNGQYTFDGFKAAMKKCAAAAEFVPQGQSNMEDIVEMWITMQKRQYTSVSAHSLLPFEQFHDGKFTGEIDSKVANFDKEVKKFNEKVGGANEKSKAPEDCYDDFLIKTIKQKIEERAQEEQKRKEALKKAAGGK